MSGILKIEEYAETAADKQRGEDDANDHLGFAGAFVPLLMGEQNFAQQIIRHGLLLVFNLPTAVEIAADRIPLPA